MLVDPKLLGLMQSRRLEDDTDFTLSEHVKERIDFHTRMLTHYLTNGEN